jgi:molybdenum cofactor cytidylyltransferase
MVATVKVIPFAVPRTIVDRCIVAALAGRRWAPTSVTPFRALRVGLLLTWLEGQPAARIEQGSRAIGERVERLGSTLVGEIRCHHDIAAVSEALGELGRRGVELLLVLGASAIVDRDDVIPAAIVATGGKIEHFGMPVDPGNLILVASAESGGASYPVIGVPSCARSPKRSGFDMVLERLAAGIVVGAREVQRMGVGGLLSEILSRPAARDARAEPERAAPDARIAALVLAAGSSRRMGDVNKLLIPIADKPMVAHAVDRVRAVLRDVVVVTGHESDAVMAALTGRRVEHVHNEHHLDGLATSLKAGVAALPAAVEAVLVCLGDMPWVRPETVKALVEAFDPEGGAHVCVPVFEGKRGNPVLWGRRFFPEILALAGDTGAKEILARHADEVVAVEVEDPGILWDVDTEEALKALVTGS